VTPAFLTISLTYADGPMFQPARQRLSLFASGMLLKDELKFAGGVTERDRPTREFSATREQFQDLGRATVEAGLTERVPNVEQVVDTSDRFAWILLHVAHDRGTQTLTLGLMSSGYQGPDAAALQRFFDVLLSLANVEDGSILHTLVGR
jgi:hypothetical protein